MDQGQFEFKQDYYGSDVYSDIPAAEEEVTVGSTSQNSYLPPSNLPYRNPQPRVVMLPPSNMITHKTPQSGLRTVRVIRVPAQGGGRPQKLAVIPKSMLAQRLPAGQTVKMVPGGAGMGHKLVTLHTTKMPTSTASSAGLTFMQTSGAGVGGQQIFQQSTGSPLRTISITPQHGAVHQMISSAQFSNLIQSSQINSVASINDDLENMFGSGIKMEASDFPAGLPPFYDSPYQRGHSPSGKESGDEHDQGTPGMKTNGLRKYARCVCDKVREKGITTYGEVADELVHEYAAEHPMIPAEQLHYIQKNIRRRVYDALNVLMALNVLQKEKKEIRWVGLPVNMLQECRRLEEERERRQTSLRTKIQEIQDLVLQLIAFKNLVMRNRMTERQFGSPPRNQVIDLPFLVISTNRKTVIDCNIANDKLEYLFNFDQAFEIRDEVDTLRRMGLTLHLGQSQCTEEEYNQCLEIVPPSLRFYVEAMYERRPAIVPDFDSLHQQRRMFVEARLAAAATSGGVQSNRTGLYGAAAGASSSGLPQMRIQAGHHQYGGHHHQLHRDEEDMDSDVDEEDDDDGEVDEEEECGSEVDVG